MLPHPGHGVDYAAIYQPEIARVGREIDVADTTQEAIEPVCRRPLDPRLPDSALANCVDHVVPLAPALGELEHDLGRILQVRVHDDHCFPDGVVEAGGQCDLMAEIARHADDLESRVTLPQLAHDLERVVDRPVVDENDLARAVELLHHRPEAPMELLERLLLVEDGYDERIFGQHLLHMRLLLAPSVVI